MNSLTGLSVLIIDDEEDFARTLAGRLELRGMRPLVASSGEEGLALMEENSPDVVLLDMRMPGLSGAEVLGRLRPARPDLPVIVVTGHCSQEDFEVVQTLGVQGYLAKPVDFEELLTALAENAGRAGAARAGGESA